MNCGWAFMKRDVSDGSGEPVTEPSSAARRLEISSLADGTVDEDEQYFKLSYPGF